MSRTNAGQCVLYKQCCCTGVPMLGPSFFTSHNSSCDLRVRWIDTPASQNCLIRLSPTIAKPLTMFIYVVVVWHLPSMYSYPCRSAPVYTCIGSGCDRRMVLPAVRSIVAVGVLGHPIRDRTSHHYCLPFEHYPTC